MEYQVRVERVESQGTAVIRLRARQEEFCRVVPQACGEVWTFFRSSGLPRPGRHVAVYLDCQGSLEVGVEVFHPFAENGRVVASCTPAGVVATTTHWGSYGRLGEAYAAIKDWCAQNGHTLSSTCWEVYGHPTDDASKVRTDVFWLLKAADKPGA
jgi:effector-binding domain-containing protein